eukprot:2082904-Pleurochrysis_carterae.AAC.1
MSVLSRCRLQPRRCEEIRNEEDQEEEERGVEGGRKERKGGSAAKEENGVDARAEKPEVEEEQGGEGQGDEFRARVEAAEAEAESKEVAAKQEEQEMEEGRKREAGETGREAGSDRWCAEQQERERSLFVQPKRAQAGRAHEAERLKERRMDEREPKQRRFDAGDEVQRDQEEREEGEREREEGQSEQAEGQREREDEVEDELFLQAERDAARDVVDDDVHSQLAAATAAKRQLVRARCWRAAAASPASRQRSARLRSARTKSLNFLAQWCHLNSTADEARDSCIHLTVLATMDGKRKSQVINKYKVGLVEISTAQVTKHDESYCLTVLDTMRIWIGTFPRRLWRSACYCARSLPKQ